MKTYDQHTQKSLALLEQLKQMTLERQDKALASKLVQAQGKLQSSVFTIVVVGEVKRGKSSFINALLGEPLLPHDVIPTTSIVTTLNHGHAEQIIVTFEEDFVQEPWHISRERLWEYVTEKGNLRNQKQVSRVDVFYPSRYLESGIVLVDTPGIGSLLAKHRQVTYGYLAHADAICVVLGSDPPLTKSEYDFLNELQECGTDQFFFVQTKIDLQPEDEWRAALDNNSALVEQALGRSIRIFPVSSKRKLMAAQMEDRERSERHLERSGFLPLDAHLEQSLVEHKGVWALTSVLQAGLEVCQLLENGINLEWMACEQQRQNRRTEQQQQSNIAAQQLEEQEEELREMNLGAQQLRQRVIQQFRALRQQVDQWIADSLASQHGSLVQELEDYIARHDTATLVKILPGYMEGVLTQSVRPLQTHINQTTGSIFASARNELAQLLGRLQKSRPLLNDLQARYEPVEIQVDYKAQWFQELKSGWYGKVLGGGAGIAIGLGLSLTVPGIALLSVGGTFMAGILAQRGRKDSQSEKQIHEECCKQARDWLTTQLRKQLQESQRYIREAEQVVLGLVDRELATSTGSLRKAYEQAQELLKTSTDDPGLEECQHRLERQMAHLREIRESLKAVSASATGTSRRSFSQQG